MRKSERAVWRPTHNGGESRTVTKDRDLRSVERRGRRPSPNSETFAEQKLRTAELSPVPCPLDRWVSLSRRRQHHPPRVIRQATTGGNGSGVKTIFVDADWQPVDLDQWRPFGDGSQVGMRGAHGRAIDLI